MKRYVPHVLAGLNLLLALALLVLWVTPQGHLRNTEWLAPAPQKPSWEVPVLNAGTGSSSSATTNSFLYTLERPLFSPSRRPAPPAPVASAAAPVEVDPLADIQLQGVYSAGAGIGGIFAKVEGKNRRIALGEQLGPWSVKEIDDRNVTLVRGDETRVLRLVPSKLSTLTPPSAAARPGGAPAAAPSGQVEDPVVRAEQERQERSRKRLELRNANRAAAGLPLLPQ